MRGTAFGAGARGHRTGIRKADPAGARGPRGGAVSRFREGYPCRAASRGAA
jgi:hypothetical protein